MRISQETISRIQEAADIVEVISDFVTLKKRGANWMACCPFHNEKTPSFSVSPVKGIYKCFGCGKGGDSLGFIMEIENLSFVEALKYLAKKYHIEIEEEEKPTDELLAQQSEIESLWIVMDFAKNLYKDLLHHHNEGQTIGLNYWKERGLNLKTVETFELGFSLSAWDALLKKAQENKFNIEILEKAGLIIKTEAGKVFDRFRERMIFPVQNLSGKTIAFGGRTLRSPSIAEGRAEAKYINSPETLIYSKSKTLYGLYQAKKAIREQDNCFLVEGYMDVLSLHQADILNVVASSGTSLTQEQIRLIKRFTDNVTVLYDGDTAGIKASLRGIDLILEEGLNVKAVVFPEGEDPDSYVKKAGSTAFQDYLKKNAKDFISFKTELYLAEIKKDPIKKAEIIREIVNSIVKISDEIKRRVFYQQCSRLLDMDEFILIAEGNKILKKQQPKADNLLAENQTQKEEKPAEKAIEESIENLSLIAAQEKETIRLLINYGKHLSENHTKLANYILDEISELDFENPLYREILDIFRKEAQKGKIPDSKYFINHSKPEIKQLTVNLIHQQYEISPNWAGKYAIFTPSEEKLLEEIALENILRLKIYQVQKMIAANEQKMQNASQATEQDNLMRIALKLEKRRKDIAAQLNNVVLKGK